MESTQSPRPSPPLHTLHCSLAPPLPALFGTSRLSSCRHACGAPLSEKVHMAEMKFYVFCIFGPVPWWHLNLVTVKESGSWSQDI